VRDYAIFGERAADESGAFVGISAEMHAEFCRDEHRQAAALRASSRTAMQIARL